MHKKLILFFLFSLILEGVFAAQLDHIAPFSWDDTPTTLAEKLTQWGIPIQADASTTQVLDAKNVPFLGYKGQLHAEFTNGVLTMLCFTLMDYGSRADVTSFSQELLQILIELYGPADVLDLSTKKRSWQSEDEQKSVHYTTQLASFIKEGRTTGQFSGKIPLRHKSTDVDGKRRSTEGQLDTSDVQFSWKNEAQTSYTLTAEISFVYTPPKPEPEKETPIETQQN